MDEKKRTRKICCICGKAYTKYTNGGRNKYCSKKCYEAAHKAQRLEREAPQREAAAKRRAEREANKAQQAAEQREEKAMKAKNKQKPKNCIDEIKNINAQALAAGMSYGKYCLMLEMQKKAAEQEKSKEKKINGVYIPERLLKAKTERR